MPRKTHNGRGRLDRFLPHFEALEFGDPLPLEPHDKLDQPEAAPILFSAGICGLGVALFLVMPILGTILHALALKMAGA